MKKALIGLTALLIGCNSAPKYDTTAAKVQLAQCLVEKGAVMYGAYWCGYCTKEKEEFGGEAWKTMQKNYVECTDLSNEAKCAEIAVEGRYLFPTWKFKNGTLMQGYTPNFLEKLAEESDCD